MSFGTLMVVSNNALAMTTSGNSRATWISPSSRDGIRFRDSLRLRGFAIAAALESTSGLEQAATSRRAPFKAAASGDSSGSIFTYTTPELFGVKEFLTLSGGWQNPADFFIYQPENKFFINNTFNSGRGLSANGFQWGGSYSAWGGYIKVKPIDWYYAQAGLYMAIPQGNVSANHGLDFQGFHPDPSLNGVYFLAETGFTPKIGASKLPGRYAAGAIYFGVENKSFNGDTNDGRWAFYWQADQMLYRAPSREQQTSLDPVPGDGKSSPTEKRAPVLKLKPKLSDKGLYFFSLFEYAPEFNNPAALLLSFRLDL